MIRLVRKLWKDRRGNAIVIAGVALPIVVGGAGLATDTIQWVLWNRELQRAADTAAIAGVYAEAQGETVSDAVCAHLSSASGGTCSSTTNANNHTGVSLLTGYPQIAYPADTGTYSKAVQVTVAVQKSLGFSSLFLKTAPTITVSATAAMVPTLHPCVKGLKKSGGPALIIDGNTTVKLGCPAQSNSNANTSVTASGSYDFESPTVAGAGSLPTSITGVTTLDPYHMASPDDLAGKYSTDIPPGCPEYTPSSNKATYTTGTGQSKITHLESYQTGGVCYSNFKFTGGTYVLDAGTYYIDSADFDTTGGTTLSGTGVTIILTGASPGTVQMNGSATINLSAPTTGSYANMLFIQSSSATTDNLNKINGDANSSFAGTFYFPSGKVQLNGNNSATTQCAMIVGDVVEFSGNANLQNDTSTCTNTPPTDTAQEVKLIA